MRPVHRFTATAFAGTPVRLVNARLLVLPVPKLSVPAAVKVSAPNLWLLLVSASARRTVPPPAPMLTGVKTVGVVKLTALFVGVETRKVPVPSTLMALVPRRRPLPASSSVPAPRPSPVTWVMPV